MSYEVPQLTVLGSFSELTLGAVDGAALDHDYPVNTPKDELTFS